MRDSTTVRVTRETRDMLRGLAEHDGISMDEELSRLARAERQRRMGRALAAAAPDADDDAWIDAGLATARDDAGR